VNSIFGRLFGSKDPRKTGAEIILSVENTYQLAKADYPDREDHHILAMVYFSKVKLSKKGGINDTVLRTEAFANTFQFACLSHPANLRALAISLIRILEPNVFEGCPELEKELASLLEPIRQTKEREGLDRVYARFNPKSASDMGKSV